MPVNVHVGTEIAADIRDAAAKALEKKGLTLSEAIYAMIVKIAEDNKPPFEVNAEARFHRFIPNAETRQAMKAVERREGLFQAKDPEDLFKQLGL